MTYRFITDHKLQNQVTKAIQEHQFPATLKSNDRQDFVILDTEEYDVLFDFHRIMLKIHQIKSTSPIDKIEKPIITVSLNQRISSKHIFFDYPLGKIFRDSMAKAGIKLAIARIKPIKFFSLDTVPFYISDEEYTKAEQSLFNSELGRPFLNKNIKNIYNAEV